MFFNFTEEGHLSQQKEILKNAVTVVKYIHEEFKIFTFTNNSFYFPLSDFHLSKISINGKTYLHSKGHLQGRLRH